MAPRRSLCVLRAETVRLVGAGADSGFRFMALRLLVLRRDRRCLSIVGVFLFSSGVSFDSSLGMILSTGELVSGISISSVLGAVFSSGELAGGSVIEEGVLDDLPSPELTKQSVFPGDVG